MAKPIDPYLDWLGIRDSRRPPNHYRLLGLDLFEEDPKIIASAADRQMTHLRKFQGGEHSDLSQQVLNELAAAKLCLLKADRKKEYDEELRQTSQIRPAEESSSGQSLQLGVDEQPSAVAINVTPVAKSQGDGGRHLTRKSVTKRPFPIMWGVAGAGALVAVILVIALAVRQAGKDSDVVKKDVNDKNGQSNENAYVDPKTPPDAHKESIDDPNGDPGDGNGHTPQTEPAPWTTKREVNPPPIRRPPDFQVTQAVLEAAMSARSAMSSRELTIARGLLDNATGIAKSDEDRDEIERLKGMLALLDEFWGMYENAKSSLLPGQTLTYNEQKVDIVTVDGEIVTLRAANQEQQDFSLAIEMATPHLVMALVEKEVSAAGPNGLAAIAAFELMDRQGDAARGKTLVSDVGSQGVLVEDLKAEASVDFSLLAARAQSEVPPVDDPVAVEKKLSIPSKAEQDKAQQVVLRVYKTRLQSKDRNELLQLVQELRELSTESSDHSANQYVMLTAALDVASSVGEADTALQILGQLDERFEVDEFELKRNVIRQLLIGRPPEDQAKKAVSIAIEMANDAVSTEKTGIDETDYAKAKDILKSALLAIASTPEYATIRKEIIEKSKAVDFESDQYRTALRIRENPSGAAENLAVGRYFCLLRNQWEKGLPFLEKGSNKSLAEIAEKEKSNPDSPEDQLKLADAWFELDPNTSRSVWKPYHRARAGHWYEKAIPGLKGIAKKSAEERLEEIAALDETGTAAVPLVRGVVEKGNVALATNGTVVRGVEHGSKYLLDGDLQQKDGKLGIAHSELPSEWTIVFPKIYDISEIKILLGMRTPRYYRYAVAVSSDGKNFVPLADRSQGQWGGWQTIRVEPSKPIKAVKIFGIYNSFQNKFVAVEFEAYCEPTKR